MKRRGIPVWLLAAAHFSSAAVCVHCFESAAYAQNQASPVAELASSMGKVSILRNGDRLAAVKGMKLYASDQIVTGANSVAKILFADGSNFVVLQEGSVEVEAYWTEAHGTKTAINSMFNLVRGKARFFFKPREGGHEGYVKTANAVMGVRGTSFFVNSGSSAATKDGVKEKTELIVLSGVVAVHNPQKPEAEVMVKANETTVVSEATPPAPPAPAKTADVAILEKQIEVLPERIPDGQPAKDIELPPPSIPTEKEQTNGSNSVQIQRGTIIKQIITPQYMVVPTNAVVASKAGISCDKPSFDKFRLAAQNLSTDAPLMGSELVQCPGLQSESIFWLGFHHIARGEVTRALELPKLLRSKNIPLDIQSERTRLIQKALEGSPADLAKATQTKNSPIAQDTEILLTLARAYTLTNNHAEAAKFYAAAQNVTRLASNTDNRIEQGYALLLKGDFHKAERTFAALRDENLDSYQSKAVARGLGLSEYKKASIDGSENDHLLLSVMNVDDFSEWSKGGLNAQWNSSIANILARKGDVKREIKKPNTLNISDSASFGEFLVGKTLRLSSGVEVDALAGISQIEDLKNLEANIKGAYRFGFGLGVGGQFLREPIAFSRMVPIYAQSWQNNTFAVFANFKRPTDDRNLAEATFTSSLFGEYDSVLAANILGRIPVHSGLTTSDFLFLKAEALYRSHAKNMLEYESPLHEMQYGGGLEWGWKPFSWALVGLDVDGGFVSRDARTDQPETTVSERDAFTENNADKRESITNESFTRVKPMIAYTPSQSLRFFVKGNFQTFRDSAKGDQSWTNNAVNVGLQWNYNAGNP
jgi:hypothetical protein